MKEQYHIEGVQELIHPEHHHFLFTTFFWNNFKYTGKLQAQYKELLYVLNPDFNILPQLLYHSFLPFPSSLLLFFLSLQSIHLLFSELFESYKTLFHYLLILPGRFRRNKDIHLYYYSMIIKIRKFNTDTMLLPNLYNLLKIFNCLQNSFYSNFFSGPKSASLCLL